MEMKLHQKNGFEYFYDHNEQHWVLYPIDTDGNRIEWDSNDNPIEAEYIVKKTELMSRIGVTKKINFKAECIKINPALKPMKVKGCELFQIIVGDRNTSYRAYSGHTDTKSDAWKSAYEYLNSEEYKTNLNK